MRATPSLHTRAGVTLIEVLVAIFITGIGLLALLVLFPLGAADMARSIQDDRAGKVAADAEALSQAGQDLLTRSGQFVVGSLFTGSANPKTAGELRAECEKLAGQAAELETRIRELRPLAPNAKVTRQVDRLIAQSLAIKRSLDRLAELFHMLENGQ